MAKINKVSMHLAEMGAEILGGGCWEPNKRTGVECLTLPVVVQEYIEDCIPIDTTRKQAFKAPIMELIGYLRGYTNANDFAKIGSPTWFGNANETQAWLDNPNRKGEDDCGIIYGAASMGDITKVFDNLSKGVDDRGEIITFWKPETFDKGCLRPCMHTHSFQLVGGTLNLTSFQRSADVALAGSWNALQCWMLLKLACHMYGYRFGKVTHVINHAHIYEPHVDDFEMQIGRRPITCHDMTIDIDPNIKSLEDLRTWVTKDCFTLSGYQHHEPISYKFIS